MRYANSANCNWMRSLTRVLALLLLGSSLHGQSNSTVPPHDQIYRLLDQLSALGLADGVGLGQRPMSQRRIAEILRAALDRSDSTMDAKLRKYLANAVAEYSRPASGPTLNSATAELVALDSPARDVERTAGIDVLLNPLVAGRGGQPIRDGITTSGTLSGQVDLSSRLAAGVTLRGGIGKPRGAKATRDFRADQLYVRAVLGNVSVLVGRDHLFFGQGETASMLMSGNARALDMIRVSTDAPIKVPVLSSVFGKISGSAFIADLGARQNYPHPQLIGYKLSSRPSGRLEFGVTLTDQMGGDGAPPGSFTDRLADLVPLIDALFLHRTLLFSNKFAGFDARYRISSRFGLQAYVDAAFDDFDGRRMKSTLTEDAGYVWGATMDCLLGCGTARVTAEYRTTGLRYYTHGYYQSGYTLDRELLGDPLGPKAQGGYLWLSMRGDDHEARIGVAHEIRSGDLWGTASTTPDDSDFHFIILEQHPAERRWRLTASLDREASSTLRLKFGGGIERLSRFDFTDTGVRLNALAEVRVEYHPSDRPE